MMVAALVLTTIGLAGLAWEFGRWMNRPMTEDDEKCDRMDALIARREQIERARTEEDYRWAHIENDWREFIDSWPVLEEAS